MSSEEKGMRAKPWAEDQRVSGKSEARVVRPHIESMTARRESQLSESLKSVLKVETTKPSGEFRPRGENEQDTEPPVVQIHIGRIEVRAVMPPPVQPVMKSAPAQPRMSLEDYLRQREGRR
jgi:hypothetical protein